MAKYGIRYTQEAADDLDIIFDYITEDNREAATGMLTKIENVILKLSANPRLGTALSTDDYSLVATGYRRILVTPYMVFYRIAENCIIVGRILHTRQDWMHLLWHADHSSN